MILENYQAELTWMYRLAFGAADAEVAERGERAGAGLGPARDVIPH